jgi:uncharacterized membrane protein
LNNIKIFLWSLLFIIPGIIAALNYSMSLFIMAQNPEIGIVEAIELSKKMMKGNKGKLFVLYLSFIGWFLLSGLTFGILMLYVYPYTMTTVAIFFNTVSSPHISENKETEFDPMREFY